MIFKSIDWVFMFIILIGGRYFGPKYFRISKREALNFLIFATFFGSIWVAIKYYTVGIEKSEVGNLFITYMITVCFYEIIAKWLFGFIESKFGGKKEKPETVITLEGKVTDIKETVPENKNEEDKKSNH